VGISLTVASSLSRRCDAFSRELAAGDLRRSRLNEFINDNRDAANQLVTNLYRAGELIQSFKQVAVDRSHAERRGFDLREASEQIVASLRPGLGKKSLALSLICPDGVAMDSYPGPYGQVLTTLFLNSITPGFADGRPGDIRIVISERDAANVEIDFSDTGAGMSEETRRKAFEPFFTTLRGQGGSGLGLHIVYNIVTQKLGGRISVESREGQGSRFRIVLPRTAPRDQATMPAAAMDARV
jgi:signal transduction histidine kinase